MDANVPVKDTAGEVMVFVGEFQTRVVVLITFH